MVKEKETNFRFFLKSPFALFQYILEVSGEVRNVVMPQRIRTLPGLDLFRNTSCSAVVLHQCHWLANCSVKQVSAILWFCLQHSCETFC